MAVSDFGSLRSEVQTWVARSDSTFTNRIEQFVALAEDRIYDGGAEFGDPLYSAPLRSRVMETTDIWGLVDGEYALPDQCLDIIKVFPVGAHFGTTGIPPERFSEYDANTTGGDASYHTIEAGVLKLAPRLTGNVKVTFYQRFPAITSTNTTGSLIVAHPNIYLAATLFEAFTFLQEGELAGAHLARLKGLIAGANRSASSLRFTGPLRTRPRTVIGG